MPKKTTKKKEYTATAIVAGKKFKGKGKTVAEAVSKINFGNNKEKIILTVSNGKETKEKVLNPAQTNRLFNSHGLMKEVALKNITIIFEGL